MSVLSMSRRKLCNCFVQNNGREECLVPSSGAFCCRWSLPIGKHALQSQVTINQALLVPQVGAVQATLIDQIRPTKCYVLYRQLRWLSCSGLQPIEAPVMIAEQHRISGLSFSY